MDWQRLKSKILFKYAFFFVMNILYTFLHLDIIICRAQHFMLLQINLLYSSADRERDGALSNLCHSCRFCY